MLEKNPTTVKLIFLNYPLRSHKFAAKAAVAALAAGRQGKFWEFHDELFKDYRKINDEKIRQIVHQLQLDEIQFEQDRNDPAILNKINQDVQEAYRLRLKGVPAVFINGKQSKSRSLSDYQKAIEKELKKAKSK